MKQLGWPRLLFREAAVIVAVNQSTYGKNLFLFRPLQKLERLISTVE
jgi:hypothetical protein